jgi:uncharacterized protein YqfA (UPF0365 family)
MNTHVSKLTGSTLVGLVAGLVLAACGGSMPPPSERLGSAEAASRTAHELGADKDPKAALHLKLAEEQIDQAKKLMADNDNKKADLTLQRANADAELAVMLAKEDAAKAEAEAAQDKVKNLKTGK